MRYLSKKEFAKQMKLIELENQQIELHNMLNAEKNKYKRGSKIETHKLLAIYLFVIFNIILVYAMAAMWYFKDLSYLGVLITDIAAQIALYGIYCLKAYKGKKQEEQMKFEKEKLLSYANANENSVG